jgi:hypothetical protein
VLSMFGGGRPADGDEGKAIEMRTCPTCGSTELETPVIRPAVPTRRSTAISEVAQ